MKQENTTVARENAQKAYTVFVAVLTFKVIQGQ